MKYLILIAVLIADNAHALCHEWQGKIVARDGPTITYEAPGTLTFYNEQPNVTELEFNDQAFFIYTPQIVESVFVYTAQTPSCNFYLEYDIDVIFHGSFE